MVILALSVIVAFAGKRALFTAKIEEEANIKLKFQTHSAQGPFVYHLPLWASVCFFVN